MAKDKPKAPSGLAALQSQIEELKSTVALTATPRKPIGLGPPAEYIAEQQAAGGIPTGFQAFLDGDEWQPIGLPPADRRRLQLVMERVGILEPQDYSPGAWDVPTARAFSQVLAAANARGMSNYEDALNEMGRQVDTYGLKPKAPRAPLVVQYENPEAVRKVVRDSSRKLLGRRLSDDEEARMITAFQSQNVAAQQAAYGAGAPGGPGGSYTAPLTATEFAETQLEGRPEAGAQRYLDAFGEITKSLGVMVERPQAIGGGR